MDLDFPAARHADAIADRVPQGAPTKPFRRRQVR